MPKIGSPQVREVGAKWLDWGWVGGKTGPRMILTLTLCNDQIPLSLQLKLLSFILRVMPGPPGQSGQILEQTRSGGTASFPRANILYVRNQNSNPALLHSNAHVRLPNLASGIRPVPFYYELELSGETSWRWQFHRHSWEMTLKEFVCVRSVCVCICLYVNMYMCEWVGVCVHVRICICSYL